jgi:hypothetical protein
VRKFSHRNVTNSLCTGISANFSHCKVESFHREVIFTVLELAYNNLFLILLEDLHRTVRHWENPWCGYKWNTWRSLTAYVMGDSLNTCNLTESSLGPRWTHEPHWTDYVTSTTPWCDLTENTMWPALNALLWVYWTYDVASFRLLYNVASINIQFCITESMMWHNWTHDMDSVNTWCGLHEYIYDAPPNLTEPMYRYIAFCES